MLGEVQIIRNDTLGEVRKKLGGSGAKCEEGQPPN
jgi:hypothetical protein